MPQWWSRPCTLANSNAHRLYMNCLALSISRIRGLDPWYPVSGWPHVTNWETQQYFVFVGVALSLRFFFRLTPCFSNWQQPLPQLGKGSQLYSEETWVSLEIPQATSGRTRGSGAASVPGWVFQFHSGQTHCNMYLTLGFCLRYSFTKGLHCYFKKYGKEEKEEQRKPT